jgi:hypothetical protein
MKRKVGSRLVSSRVVLRDLTERTARLEGRSTPSAVDAENTIHPPEIDFEKTIPMGGLLWLIEALLLYC